CVFFFFFQAEDGIRDRTVTGVQTCALPIFVVSVTADLTKRIKAGQIVKEIAPIVGGGGGGRPDFAEAGGKHPEKIDEMLAATEEIGRASCRERGESGGGGEW